MFYHGDNTTPVPNALYTLHKKVYNSSPGFFSKTTGVKRKRKVKVEEARLRIRCKKLFSSSSRNVPAEDYGPAAQRLDLEVDILASESYEVLQNLKKSEEEV